MLSSLDKELDYLREPKHGNIEICLRQLCIDKDGKFYGLWP